MYHYTPSCLMDPEVGLDEDSSSSRVAHAVANILRRAVQEGSFTTLREVQEIWEACAKSGFFQAENWAKFSEEIRAAMA